MTALFFGDISPEGRLSIARRYVNDARVWDYCVRFDWNPDAMQGEDLPGHSMFVHQWRWDVPGCYPTLKVLWLLGLGSTTDEAVFTRDAGLEEVFVPAPSDLDETGACRCGCGYVAGAP